MSPENKPGHGEMSIREAAIRGGMRVREPYYGEREYFQRIGKLGGDIVVRKYGHDFFVELGRKGGQRMRDTHGSDYFSEIGRKGGNALLAAHGREYFVTIRRMGRRK